VIPRYSRSEMTAVWQDENRYKIWFDIEATAAEGMAKIGMIPESAATAIRAKGNFDIPRIAEIEAEVKHDVIAFLTSVAEFVGDEARFMHQGMTSSDVLDTCLAIQLRQASDILIADMEALLAALKKRAFEFKNTPTIGRSHGIHAEPTTFGVKLAGFYAEFSRNLKHLRTAREEISTCKISGAVGNYANISPEIEEYVAEKLSLNPETVATQVIPRDRHAFFFAVLGCIASSIEHLAIEIRHLQRSELGEAEEFFSKGQKGSSAMPHKRNPVLTENLTGLARLVRGYSLPAMENVALWHERDISHSSVERVIAPDATIALDFALFRLTGVIEKLVVYPENMKRNLDASLGLYFSQAVMLELTQRGISREAAYSMVQTSAMKAWQNRLQFKAMLLENTDVTKVIPPVDIDKIFDESRYMKGVDKIFQRVFG